ncbi:hypothetical protein NEUTE2DRAFT_61236 [Neurospora tetrasperma FGSC 2509]|nr:hypothetical protein NEUTE2DRAFT_61236 [Neurospora tetrasperma FGSC 2509]
MREVGQRLEAFYRLPVQYSKDPNTTELTFGIDEGQYLSHVRLAAEQKEDTGYLDMEALSIIPESVGDHMSKQVPCTAVQGHLPLPGIKVLCQPLMQFAWTGWHFYQILLRALKRVVFTSTSQLSPSGTSVSSPNLDYHDAKVSDDLKTCNSDTLN